MTYFNFSRLIKKYTRPFTVISKSDEVINDAGDYVDGEITKTTLYGAIMGLTESKIHRSEGTLTTMDKVLHMLEPIDNALMGAKVVFKGNEYRIETQKGKDNADFTGVYSYTLKYVSAFKEKEGGTSD